jgi:hypothetical protein
MTLPLRGKDHRFESGWAHTPFFPSGMLTAVSLFRKKKSLYVKEKGILAEARIRFNLILGYAL